MAAYLRVVVAQFFPGCDAEHLPHQVDTGDFFGDRVFHLQAGVDFQEREEFVVGPVEEFDGGGPSVADSKSEAFRGGFQVGGLHRAEHGGRGFFDDFLVAALHRAVAHPQCPGGALAVGDHLHFHVAGAGDQAFQEHGVAAEGAGCFLAGPLIGVDKLGFGGDDADAAPAPAGGGFQHQRIADGAGRSDGLIEGGDGAAAPRGHGHSDLFGEEFRADLVAELPHRVRAGADKGDSELFAQFRESGVFRDKPPADPGGISAGVDERTLQHFQVEVGTCGRGTEVVGDVGFTDEGGGAVNIGRSGVDLIDDGNHDQVVVLSQSQVGHRLGLNALRGVDQQ